MIFVGDNFVTLDTGTCDPGKFIVPRLLTIQTYICHQLRYKCNRLTCTYHIVNLIFIKNCELLHLIVVNVSDKKL